MLANTYLAVCASGKESTGQKTWEKVILFGSYQDKNFDKFAIVIMFQRSVKVSVSATFDQSRPVSVLTIIKFLSLDESQSR